MIFRRVILFLLGVLPFLAAAADVPWHDSLASYRMELEQPKSDAPAFLDDRFLCLPVSLKNRGRAFDAEGDPVPLCFLENGGVLIERAESDRTVWLYFGYPTAQPNGFTGKGLEHGKLEFCFLRGDVPSVDPAKWSEFTRGRRAKILAEFVKNVRVWSFCTHHGLCPVKVERYLSRRDLWWMPFHRKSLIYELPRKKNALLFLNHAPEWRFCLGATPFDPDYAQIALSRSVCTEKAITSMLNRYCKMRADNAAANKEEKTKDPVPALEETLFSLFPEHARSQALPCQRLALIRRSSGRTVSIYRGRLVVPETAEYTFRVRARASRILRIDGKTLIREYGDVDPRFLNGTDSTAVLNLEKGTHLFEFCYHQETAATCYQAEWKKTDETAWRVLRVEDFAPSVPLIPRTLEAQSGLRYPVYRFRADTALFTAKTGTAALCEFFPADASARIAPPCSVRFNDSSNPPVPGSLLALIPARVDVPKNEIDLFPPSVLSLTPEAPGFDPLPFSLPDETIPRIRVQAELSLKIHTPLVLFNDETLDYDVEILSRLPLGFDAVLRTSVSARNAAEGALHTERDEMISFPATPMENADRFAPARAVKRTGRFSGVECAQSRRTYDFRVLLPELEMTHGSITVSSLREIDSLQWKNRRFYTADDSILIPLLHRPTLREQREWELPKALARTVAGKKKLLVVAEDLPGFRDALANAVGKRGIEELTFIPYRAPGADKGAVLHESMPDIFQSVRASDADCALLIPPLQSRRTTVSAREELRCFALLMELVSASPHIRSMSVATPFPSDPADGMAEPEREFSDEMRRLCRSYSNVRFLELYAFLQHRGLPGGNDFLDDTGLRTRFPRARVAEAAVQWLMTLL